MADYGVAVTWGDAKNGREKKALDLWIDAVTFYEKSVADGRIESWDAILFEPNGLPPAGVIRSYGTREQINEFAQADDFGTVLLRAELFLNNVSLRRFVAGNALAEGFAQYTQVLESL